MSGHPPTPGQTVGPFFGYALPYPGDNELVPRSAPGAIRLHGSVSDGAGQPVPDALIEIWQAAPDGTVSREPGSLHRDGWTFTGFGRAATRLDGGYTFTTRRPGPTEPGAAAFFAVTVFARGLLDLLFTRAYLPEDADALTGDPLLASLPEQGRATLLARPDADGYRFDIRLQGEDETVFLRFGGH